LEIRGYFALTMLSNSFNLEAYKFQRGSIAY